MFEWSEEQVAIRDAVRRFVSRETEPNIEELEHGNKTLITNGPHADTIVYYAKLEDGSGGPLRQHPVLTFIFDRGMPGLEQLARDAKVFQTYAGTNEIQGTHIAGDFLSR